jgi:hypothetical protein
MGDFFEAMGCKEAAATLNAASAGINGTCTDTN